MALNTEHLSRTADVLEQALLALDLSRLDLAPDLQQALQDSLLPILVDIHDWAGLPSSFQAEIERDMQ
ncbi:MAG: hypothetical protein AB3X44_06335 [Leptothrix sp. (in: b-proteobacteria)]